MQHKLQQNRIHLKRKHKTQQNYVGWKWFRWDWAHVSSEHIQFRYIKAASPLRFGTAQNPYIFKMVLFIQNARAMCWVSSHTSLLRRRRKQHGVTTDKRVSISSKTLNRCGSFACIFYDIIVLRSLITAQMNNESMNIQLIQSFEMATFGFFSLFLISKSMRFHWKTMAHTNPVSHSTNPFISHTFSH